MKHRLLALIAVVTLLTAPAFADQKIKVGISGGDSEIVWGKVKEIAAKDGLDVQVVVFSDYLLPNAALDAGDLDANAFQHKPFLDNQIKTRGYKITPVGETIVAPIGLYSKKVKSVSEIEDGSSIGIPNDPSNGGRALKLLEQRRHTNAILARATSLSEQGDRHDRSSKSMLEQIIDTIPIMIHAADRDLHSGSFGGLAANPIQVLVNALATVKDAEGRVTLPGFYEGVEELSNQLRADWDDLGFDAGEYLSRVGLRHPVGETGRTGLEMV